MNVAVIGATNKPDRYAYMAIKLLSGKGHRVFPVHPRLSEIEGVKVFNTLRDIPDPIDTVTLYVGAMRSLAMAPEILECRPKRIIFNPGAENDVFQKQAQAAGIETVRGCTIMMLKTNQF